MNETRVAPSRVLRRGAAGALLATVVAMLATVAGVAVRPAVPRIQVLVSMSGTPSRQATLLHRLGGRVTRELPIIGGASVSLPASSLPVLRADAAVRWATPDRSVQLHGQYGEAAGVASAVYSD